MYRSDDPGGVELRFSIFSIYARGIKRSGGAAPADLQYSQVPEPHLFSRC